MKDSRRDFLKMVLASTVVAVSTGSEAVNAAGAAGGQAHALDLAGAEDMRFSVPQSELGLIYTYVSIKNTLPSNAYVSIYQVGSPVDGSAERRPVKAGKSFAETVYNDSVVNIFSVDAQGNEVNTYSFTAGSLGEMARTIDLVADDTGAAPFKIVEDLHPYSS